MKNILLIIMSITAGGFGFIAYGQAQKNVSLERQLSSMKQEIVAPKSNPEVNKLKNEVERQNHKINQLKSELERKKTFIERLEKSYEKLVNQKTTITDDMGSQFRTKNLPKPEVKRVVIKPRPRPIEKKETGSTHMCKAGDDYFYSSKPCDSASNIRKVNMMVNQVNWNPNEPEAEEDKKEPTHENRPEKLSGYKATKKRLSKQCEGISDSRQRLTCRKNAMRQFAQNCKNESLSKNMRRASCSLADSYRVVE